ncbi:MAG: alpha/beta hydrolase [Planctomycetaceae bacterium]
MMRVLTMLVVVAGLWGGTICAQAPEPKASAEALAALQQALKAETINWQGLTEGTLAKVPLTRDDAAAAKEALWQAHTAGIRRERADEVKNRVLKDGDLAMPFAYTVTGDKPATGRSLWISLHGGGGAPPRVNDQQWENQKRLYKVEEGIYLAPRAPTNTWNLWHEGHIDRLFTRLIEDLVVFEDVNPNKVYVLGYSAGGDGVYQIGPRLADRWAAAAMMAGHPNDASPLSLRNVPFALQVGGNDSAYNRNKVARNWGDQLVKLHEQDPKGYETYIKIHEGKGHWMDLADAAALPWMAGFTRNPIPERVVWKQTGQPHERSYWLAVPKDQAKVGSLVTARREKQAIEVETVEGLDRLIVRLDDRMADLDDEVVIRRGEKVLLQARPLRTISTLVSTLVGRGDRDLMFSAEMAVDLTEGQ